MIPFNKAVIAGNELKYIEQVARSGKLSGDGEFTQKVHSWFQENYGFKKVLLTTSCTDALEMCALAIDTQEGDEIIVPDYTFVSTANAFANFGAKIVFADSRPDHPGIDEESIEKLITEKTKALVVVHYAGVAVDMNKVVQIARKYNIFLIEDAAQAIDSSYFNGEQRVPLGSIGDFATFSFHDTKNIISGEGGLLVINNDIFIDQMETIWEKGTNRKSFFRGMVDKYGWVSKGSSYLASEITAAFLFAQLEQINRIQGERREIWNRYSANLQELKNSLPIIPEFAENNGHMFYFKTDNLEQRTQLINFLKTSGITAVFHYLPLHQSKFVQLQNWDSDNAHLTNSVRYSSTLLRLPIFIGLRHDEIDYIAQKIIEFYRNTNEKYSELGS